MFFQSQHSGSRHPHAFPKSLPRIRHFHIPPPFSLPAEQSVTNGTSQPFASGNQKESSLRSAETGIGLQTPPHSPCISPSLSLGYGVKYPQGSKGRNFSLIAPLFPHGNLSILSVSRALGAGHPPETGLCRGKIQGKYKGNARILKRGDL